MSRKFYNIKNYSVGDYTFTCMTQDTAYGFRHLCDIKEGWNTVATSKACYYNRTWESYEYESVISKAIDKLNLKEDAIINAGTLKAQIKQQATGEIDKELAFIGAFAKLGEVLADNQSDANDFKKRILNAGLGSKGLSFPEDWDTLSEDEKQKRLDGAISQIA